MTADKLLKRIRKGKYKLGARFYIVAKNGKVDKESYIKYVKTEGGVREFFLCEPDMKIPDSRFDTSLLLNNDFKECKSLYKKKQKKQK